MEVLPLLIQKYQIELCRIAVFNSLGVTAMFHVT